MLGVLLLFIQGLCFASLMDQVEIEGQVLSFSENIIVLKGDNGKKIEIPRSVYKGNPHGRIFVQVSLEQLGKQKDIAPKSCVYSGYQSTVEPLKGCGKYACFGTVSCGARAKIHYNYACLSVDGGCPSPDKCIAEDLKIDKFVTVNEKVGGAREGKSVHK